MPLYQMLCIAVHYEKYQFVRGLVQQTATHIMNAGGVVRNIESWGTLELPHRMKKKGSQEYARLGDYWSLYCDTSPQTLRSLKTLMRRDPRVLRWSILKLADRVEDVASQSRRMAQKGARPGEYVDM